MSSIKILLTASEDFGKAEIEIEATDPQDAYAKVSGLGDQLVNEVIAQQTLLAKGLKASHGLAPSAPPQGEPTQPIAHPSQPAQSAQPPAWAQQQPSNVVQMPQQGQQQGEVCDNSDGKSPAACGLALQPKTTRTGKNQLVCPQYRYSSGQGGNGHRVVWL